MDRRITDAGIPAQLWRRVALAPHRLLMLDYDGTLAPFALERDRALPSPRSLESLRAIAGAPGTTLAIVSGRPVEALVALVGPLAVTLVGEHGWETRGAEGGIERRPVPGSVAAVLDRAEQSARGSGWARRLERKRSGLVLHTRGLEDREAHEVEERCALAWGPLTAPGLVRLDRIDGGLELRAAGCDKGAAAVTLLSQEAAGTLAVFVGDDTTDEDAFAAVSDRGFGVRVGQPSPRTRASAWLPSWEAVPAFLEEWARVARSL